MLTRVPVYHSLHRPNLLLGAPRNPLIFLGFLAMAIVLANKTVISVGISLALWLIGLFVLRLMAKRDAAMIQVFKRYKQYSHYYPARSSVEGAKR